MALLNSHNDGGIGNADKATHNNEQRKAKPTNKDNLQNLRFGIKFLAIKALRYLKSLLKRSMPNFSFAHSISLSIFL